jgi:hypothetical protein
MHAAETGPGFDRDPVLLLTESPAGQGAVTTVSAGSGAAEAARGRRWSFHALGRDVEVEEATVEQCVRRALPVLREILPAGEGVPASAPTGNAGIEGIGVLVLDWLVDQGMSVFLKADGERRTTGWTLLVHRGPLSRALRADGPRAEECFRRMTSLLRTEGIAVPA